MAATACISGPPCMNGNTALSMRWRVLGLAHDHAAARAAQHLVGREGDDVGVGHRATGSPCPATSPMKCAASTIRIAPTSSAISRNAAKSISRGMAVAAGDDHLRPVLAGEVAHLVVVDVLGLRVDAVVHRR